MKTAEDFGRAAYDAYWQAIGYAPGPWKDLDAKVKGSWVAAAKAAIEIAGGGLSTDHDADHDCG